MDEMPVPRHLTPIAEVAEQEDTCATLRLRCPCGCSLFRMERAEYSPEERAQIQAHEDSWRAATGGYRVKDGKNGPLRKRGLLGRWEPFDYLPRPACCAVTAIRAICADCGAIHLVFDNRLHGFRAASGLPVPAPDCKPLWVPAGDATSAQGCQVEVSYPMPRFQFETEHPGVEFDNAFDCIDVSGRSAQGHVTPVLSAYA
jgi:hypothetical protein